MKNTKVKFAGLSCGLALLLGASAAPADPISTITTPSGSTQTSFVGSDTLNEVVDTLLPTLSLSQITSYQGLGSSQGERFMEGTSSGTSGDPVCTPAKIEGQPAAQNPGCAEIAPMSREFNATICDDDFVAPNTKNVSAQELAIARDGIAIVTDNAAHRQYGDNAAACTTAAGAADSNNGSPFTVNAAYSGVGKLRAAGTITLEDGSSYPVGANSTGWKDVLRLVYTGCDNTQGSACLTSVARATRCTSTARKTVIDRWDYLVESGAVGTDSAVACANAGACADNAAHDGGVRAAYRRDDTSGTTGVFLSLLGLTNTVAANLTGRASIVSTLGWAAIPTAHAFCDGGQLEDFWFSADPTLDPVSHFPTIRTSAAPTVNPQGDPITKPCKPEDVLCGYDKRIGVVRPIRSGEGTNQYPPFQCTKSLFDSIQFINTVKRVCPDGSAPNLGQCLLPYYLDTTVTPNVKHYNCVANIDTKPTSVPTAFDGRAYNYVMKNDVTGAPEFITAGSLPQVAQWRQNMALLTTTGLRIGGPIPAANLHCEEADATRNIGCIVSKTTCTLGWAGREVAATDPYDNTQEALRLVNSVTGNATTVSDAELLTTDPAVAYPFARSLFINAIGGFGNITADCSARGGTTAYCADEVSVVNALLHQSAGTQTIIRNAGFIPFPGGNAVCQNPPAALACGSSAASPDCTPH